MDKHENSLERSGYTLRDLLIVVAIVALALTVIMPWVLQQNVSSSQNHNRNQVKQVGLALQNHNDQFKTFPPLFFSGNSDRKRILNPQLAGACYPWQVRLLPFLEEDKLYKNLESASQYFDLDSTTVQIPDPEHPEKLISPNQLCFSFWHSYHNARQEAGEYHYVALPATKLPLLLNLTTDDAGDPKWLPAKPDGMIIPDKQARGQSMARMADGTSKTAVINETRERQRSNWYQPQQAFVCGFLPVDSTPVPDEIAGYYPYFDRKSNGGWVFNPQQGDRTAINFSPYHEVANDELSRTWGPSGTHPNGKMLLGMGDGSAQEVDPENLEPRVYYAAITARGGENRPSIAIE